MDVRINYFEAFKEVYGFVAADDVLRFSTMLLGEVIDELGTSDDFIGHPGGNNFIIISSAENGEKVQATLRERFAEQVLSHYNFMDREQGFITTTNDNGEAQKTPLMTISIGSVSPAQHQFADIREITELAADARRKDTNSAS